MQRRDVLQVTTDLLTRMSISFAKEQSKTFCNYYVSPSMGIRLFDAKVSWIDNKNRHISFGFDKSRYAGTLGLLKLVNAKIFESVSTQFKLVHKTCNPLYYEKGDYFYVNCYLPGHGKSYSINSTIIDSGEVTNEDFIVPRQGLIYKYIDIEFKNYWETNKQAGICIELKDTCIDFTSKK